MKQFCFTCDLKDDPQLIQDYINHHKPENVWPEINQSILDAGVTSMEIFISGNRLFMIMQTLDEFSLEEKALMDKQNSKVQEWENLMWHFQQAVPWAIDGEKWTLMKPIFNLS